MHTGSCLCGGVRFQIEGDLAPIQLCRCVRLPQGAGRGVRGRHPGGRRGVPAALGRAPAEGLPRDPGKARVFCGACGSPVYSRLDAAPGTLRVRAGLLLSPVASRPASAPSPKQARTGGNHRRTAPVSGRPGRPEVVTGCRNPSGVLAPRPPVLKLTPATENHFSTVGLAYRFSVGGMPRRGRHGIRDDGRSRRLRASPSRPSIRWSCRPMSARSGPIGRSASIASGIFAVLGHPLAALASTLVCGASDLVLQRTFRRWLAKSDGVDPEVGLSRLSDLAMWRATLALACPTVVALATRSQVDLVYLLVGATTSCSSPPRNRSCRPSSSASRPRRRWRP